MAAARTVEELDVAGALVADLALWDRGAYWDLCDRYFRRQAELLALFEPVEAVSSEVSNASLVYRKELA